MTYGHPIHIRGILYMIGVAVLAFATGPAWAIDTSDAFPMPQENPNPSLNAHPLHKVAPQEYRSHNPNLTGEINQPHPIPEYLKKFPKEGRFPKYYYQLLQVDPEDQVQSKVFNPQAFKQARRIGVVFFENKTNGLGADENAGHLVANQFSTELETVEKLSVVSPTRMLEEFQLKIVATPEQAHDPGSAGVSKMAETSAGYDLPYSKDKFDAVLIGSVTRYTELYRNSADQPDTSPGAGVEFSVYLISTQTGEAIWGARFVGSQSVSLANVFSAQNRWLDKKDYSREAIKKVLKDFRDMAEFK
ncbi:MAG: hypothetical protein OEZ51_15180 [Nitrospinota bacterium]|nr:hypothetical protein [Nitrospinota bacterium]